MYLKKFENENGILYYNPASDAGIYDIAAAIRAGVSPDEAVFLFGSITRPLLDRADLPELLLKACVPAEQQLKNVGLLAGCKIYEGCRGLYQLCKDTLDGTITLANENAVQPDIHYLTGDATAPQESGQKIIAHVCNDIGAWGSGFVMALSTRWAIPEQRYRTWYRSRSGFLLGAVQYVPVELDITIANMVAQHGIYIKGKNDVPIRYQALDQCLLHVARRAIEYGASVHMPRIGCGRAGGTWSEVEPIVRHDLVCNGVHVYVYDPPALGLRV